MPYSKERYFYRRVGIYELKHTARFKLGVPIVKQALAISVSDLRISKVLTCDQASFFVVVAKPVFALPGP